MAEFTHFFHFVNSANESFFANSARSVVCDLALILFIYVKKMSVIAIPLAKVTFFGHQ